MFRWLFGEEDIEEEEETKVDPIVEQRRKEKFSEPLIYNEEYPKEEEEKKVEEKPVEKAPEPKPVYRSKPKKEDNVYQMRDIISPMSGMVSASGEKDADGNPTPIKKKKHKYSDDGLVPIISPMFGYSDKEEEKEEEKTKEEKKEEPAEEKPTTKRRRSKKENTEVKKEEEKKEVEPEKDSAQVIDSVEDRLRNIATLTEQTHDDLKIIEERTGKFKLDRKKDEDSMIDEIDDNMSLDELMSLYEKKFKD